MRNRKAHDGREDDRQHHHHQGGVQQGPQEAQDGAFVADLQLLESQSPNQFAVTIRVTNEFDEQSISGKLSQLMVGP